MIIKIWLQMDDEITEVTHEHPGMVLLLDNGYSQVISDFASFLVAVGWDPLTVDNAFESREPYVQEQSVLFQGQVQALENMVKQIRGSANDLIAESERGPQWTEETEPE